MNRIFISYKRADKELVFPLKERIEAATGEQCWIDLEGIESDAQFVNVIMRSIDQADLFLFMFSKNHAKIDNYETDWTVREITYAQKKKKRIVFVNLDQTPMNDWFDFMFGLKQVVDATNEQAVERLTQDICKWLNVKYQQPKQTQKQIVYVSKDNTYVPFGASVVRCFRKYALLQGRASRSEFWWWIFFQMILLNDILFLCILGNYETLLGYLLMGVYFILCLTLLLPTIAVWVRRLHDTNHSGWWIFCPLYNILLALMEATPGANTYGELERVDISNESPFWQNMQRKWIPIILLVYILGIIACGIWGGNKEQQHKGNEVEQVVDTLALKYDLYLEGTMVDPAELIYNSTTQSGQYYVDRNGHRVTRSILLKDYDEQTGDLSLEAYTEASYIGVFEGKFYVSGTRAMYSGIFTNASGKYVKFNLTGTATQ